MVRFTPSASSLTNVSSSDASVARQAEEASGSNAGPASSSHRSANVVEGIKAISKTDVHRITSGQVVLDLQSAVKELIENSLDAASTSIEVRFKNFGLDGFEVVDNGSGIKEEDYESVGLKHHTSKLETFDDLTTVTTFGFRGEALSSLCAHAKVTILTATREQAPMGTLLEFSHEGALEDSSKKLARQRGCTVTVDNLFHSLPVRRRELEKNIKREYSKCQSLLQAYGLIAKGVRWNIVNVSKEGRRNIVLAISSASSSNWMSQNVASLFGPKAPATLRPLDIKLELERSAAGKRERKSTKSKSAKRRRLNGDDPDEESDDDTAAMEEDASDAEAADDPSSDEFQTIEVKGLISYPTRGSGRTSSDRQYLYINGRPWDNVRMTRAFNEVYRQYNTNQVPVVIADFRLETDTYDVNVSPDKRTIFLHEETKLIEALKVALEDLFAPSRGTFAVHSQLQSSTQQSYIQQRLSGLFQPAANSREDQNDTVDEDEELREHLPTREEVDQENGKEEQPEEDDDRAVAIVEYGHLEDVDEETSTIDDHEVNEQISIEQETGARLAVPSARPEPTSSWDRARSRVPLHSSNMSQPSLPAFKHPVQPASRLSTHQPASRPPTQSASNGTRPTGIASLLQSYAHSGRPSTQSTADRILDVEELEYREEALNEDEQAAGEEGDAEARGERNSPRHEDVPTDIDTPSDPIDDNDATQLRSKHVSVLPSEQTDDDDRDRRIAELAEEEDEAVDEPAISRGEKALQSTEVEMASLRRSVVARRQYRQALKKSLRPQSARSEEKQGSDLSQAGIENQDAQQVESQLERVINKRDFESMQIIGQFNLGFILARRRTATPTDDPLSSAMDDLFVIDQHASDEKYNYERLQRETKIRSQRLIQPRLLELSATDELVAMDHQETLRSQGFELSIDEDGVAGSRVRLVAQPVSKNIVFGPSDLSELLHLLRDVSAGIDKIKTSRIQCSKAKAMFASRACRSSVMIGMALTQKQMKTIVRHMGTTEQPWNCPHGRPTMRHLVCLKGEDGTVPRRQKVDWSQLKEL